MRKVKKVLAALFLLGPSLAVAGQFVESFDGGSNVGAWTFGAPTESIVTSGGNPGAFLDAAQLDIDLPFVRTSLGTESVFTGDFRAAGVTSVGADLNVIDVDVVSGAREGTVILYSDNGTPGTVLDDWGAYQIGSFVSFPGFGWVPLDFDVPAQATSWPSGWGAIHFGPTSPPGDWNALITSVSSLGFYLGNPEDFYLPEVWELGLDNPRITADNMVAVEAQTWGAVKSLFH